MKVKIVKSRLQHLWYADLIDSEFVIDVVASPYFYITSLKEHGVSWQIWKEDCEVIEEGTTLKIPKEEPQQDPRRTLQLNHYQEEYLKSLLICRHGAEEETADICRKELLEMLGEEI